ncbi:GL10305 [Drosophila persimilis]|uniref:GL10305 n=1 Tax=Drosophila persimilis TaxID=7234 RepID=B4H9G3_DROPE|nr:GL10305 [Drosophila persimilis]
MQNEATENVEPQPSTATPVATTDFMQSPPAAAPRRPKPGILRLDIGKPRRSSGGSVDFRCVGSSGSGSGSNIATGANSEVSEHDLLPAGECLRFGQANDMCSGSNHGNWEENRAPTSAMAAMAMAATTTAANANSYKRQ